MADKLPPYDPARARRTLFSALVDARAQFGRTNAIVTDGDERTLTYEELVRAALALGHALKAGTKKGETIGVLLPTGIGSVIAVLALSAYGRVPAMLNFTAGEQSLRTALKMAKIARVVTAHRFVELGKFEALEAWMKTTVKMVYLEEVREKLSLFDKVTAVVGSMLPRQVATRVSPNSPAVILFTSGTEGEPKGVVLSHANILANVEQVRAHIAFYPDDVVFNPLPTFHSFGLTVGALMPLYLGVKAVLHPTPRQPHEIVAAHQATSRHHSARDGHICFAIRPVRGGRRAEILKARGLRRGAPARRNAPALPAKIHGRAARRVRRDGSLARSRRQPVRDESRRYRRSYAPRNRDAHRSGGRYPRCRQALCSGTQHHARLHPRG